MAVNRSGGSRKSTIEIIAQMRNYKLATQRGITPKLQFSGLMLKPHLSIVQFCDQADTYTARSPSYRKIVSPEKFCSIFKNSLRTVLEHYRRTVLELFLNCFFVVFHNKCS